MWERRIVDLVLRHRLLVLAVTVLLTALAGYQARKLTFDSDIEIWFLENDRTLRTYREFLDLFQADETEVIGIFAEDIFAPDVLNALDRITREAADAPFVHDVMSLSNAKVVDRQGPLQVAIGPLMESLPGDAQEAIAFRERALSNVLIADNLVSADGRATAILIEIDPSGNTVDGKAKLIEALDRIVAHHLPEDVEYNLSGSPTLDEAFYRYTERDFMVLGPVSAAVVLFACLFLLRLTSASLTPLIVVIVATTWTFGVMGTFGLKINVVSSSLIALIFAVGVADSIHVISDYYQELMSGKERNEAIAHSTSVLLTPCLFTSATTAAGFLSLLISDLKPIYEFGWLAAVGVALAFLLSMTLLPAVLRILPAPRERAIRRERSGATSRLLDRLGRPTRRSSIAVLAGSSLLLVAAVYSISHLKMGANPMNYFLRGDPVRTAMTRVDKALGGSGTFDLLVNTGPGGLKEPAVLKRMEELEQRLESLPGITRVLSLLDALRETRRLLTDGARESATLPDNRPMAAQFYLMLESDADFRELIKGDYQTTRMTARVQFYRAHQLLKRIDDLEADLQKHYSDDELQVTATGYTKLMSEMETYLLRSQVRSMLVAFVVITFMMLLLLRSPVLALFSMIPNFVPIALGLAIMPPAGIALDPGTVMIGSVALGLVVDDTVHFLVRLRRNLAFNDLPSSISRSMKQTGRPIIYTSLILVGGFFTLTLGSFNPNVSFGLITAIVIFMALIADLVMLPAALLIITPRLGTSNRKTA